MKPTPDPKKTVRLEARTRRDALDPSWRKAASADITCRAIQLPELSGVDIVSAYVSTGSEVETGLLLSELIQMTGGVALPRLSQTTGLLDHWYVTTLGDPSLRPGPFGILEPDPQCGFQRIEAAQIGIFFMPGLAFDLEGNRLGMGGGHYDRYLAASPRSCKYGLAFSGQIVPALPVLPTDIRLNGLITESRNYRFRPSP